ncbi:MAG: sodium:calcium antiporter [Candidatus Marinimicrobia bacterium]|nr:sodium:calcium antiporter [Candidatus Neomarinimicrobiota bacterium]
MDVWIAEILVSLPLIVLFVVIAISLLTLMKGADLLVDQAVSLSIRWGVPKILIGATIVSLGTTLPEVAVSVMAAVQGVPGLALGNAVGSIITDTGLILGLAILIGRVPVNQMIVSRQSWIQLGSTVLLVLVSLPYLSLSQIFKESGNMPQYIGWIFLLLLGIYIWQSIAWSRRVPADNIDDSTITIHTEKSSFLAGIELVLGIILVIISSKVLIPVVQETAIRLYIPDAIIAATLVAFGTSLPELVTAIKAVRKGHGELALGNILGADIFNVLFVSGAAAAVTRGGLQVPPQFFYLFFPSMLFVVIMLRLGIGRTSHQFSKLFGVILLLSYILTVVLGYVVPGGN